MNKYDLFRLIFILNIIVFHKAHAQTNDSILASITGKLTKYTANVPREEIFIHSDKEEYIAGEDIWMKVLLIDRQSCQLSDRSRIVYLEILNSDYLPVIQKRILIKNGAGPGHLTLPDTMSTGFYTIRAYTSWMKNFLPFNCFTRDITVFNTFKKEGAGMLFRRRNQFPVKAMKQGDPGFVLNVNNTSSDTLEIILERTVPGLNVNGCDYIIIQTRGNIEYSARMINDKNISRSSIPKSLFAEGINQVVIFNSEAIPVAEKLFYVPVKKNEFLKINSKSSYGLRDKVKIDLQSFDPSVQSAEMSISVSLLVDSIKQTDIRDYLVFGSEFNSEAGLINENMLEHLTQEDADSILSGLSSNWIRWSDILAGNIPQLKYPCEDNYHIMEGYVNNSENDTILMFSPGRGNTFQYTVSDSTGRFKFKHSIDEEEKDLILMLYNNNNHGNRRITLLSSFSETYPDSGDAKYSYEAVPPLHFSRPGIDFQVRTLFRTPVSDESTGSLYLPPEPIPFYGIPDIEVDLSEFVELPTMPEVFTELIPGVSLQKVKSQYQVVITQRINDRRFVFYPVIMIDGVVVRYASVIAELDPALVEKIDIISKKYLVGGYLFDGIVNVITKTADFSCIPLPDYMIRLKYKVAEPVPVFHSPDYSDVEMRNSRIPDYRNVLYWNPSITAETPAEFWSSDNKANYLIKIEGITISGSPFSVTKIISVE